MARRCVPLDADKGHFLLHAPTPVGGRSLTLYEEVHTLGCKEKPKVHQAFPDGQRIAGSLPGFRSTLG